MRRGVRNSVVRKCNATLVNVLLIVSTSLGQTIVAEEYRSYGLAIDSLNVIQNRQHLDDFYEALYQLNHGTQTKVNIVHIGDSHIQADFLTKAVRNNFQKHFGNAGRGLIVPGRVAGTNEPFNIQTSSNVTWEVKRCVHPAHHLPIGIGGITLRSGVPSSRLYIYMNDQVQDYTFQTVKLFHLKDGSSFGLALKDSDFKLIPAKTVEDTTGNYTEFRLPSPVNSIVVESLKNDSIQNHTTLFGLSLENQSPGVLYHVIGVNGAKYAHYNAAKLFARQTHKLNPALFIISLGTNEALDYPHIDRRLFSQIETLVSTLRANNPLAKIILVTPPDCFMRKTRPNAGIAKVREAILQFAVENGLAFYDMYQALGGEGSASRWKEAQLLRADGVHFTKEGYDYQGNLLFHAILKGYNDYVPDRHP
ncbi:MAG TPA: GDSL-type esterase/lipase family protein [Chryseosolibacter sp.]